MDPTQSLDYSLNPSDFPTLPVGPETNHTTLYRSHNAYNPDGTVRDPRFFSPMHITPTGQRRGGRFDLQHPLGTCNTGATAAAALRERLAHSYAILSSDLENVRVSKLRILHPLILLDARHDGPGYTARDISDRINKHTILRLKDGAGRNGYPLFQFSNGTVDPNIQQIIQTLLDGHFSEWQTALWITTPSLMYNGASPLEYLRTSPKHFGQVLAHAENDVNDLYANS